MGDQPQVVVVKQGGFWRGCLGAMFGMALVFALIIGGCVLVAGSCATRIAMMETEARDYANRNIDVSISHFGLNGSGGFDTIRGSVTNTGARTVTYWQITLQYKDRGGNVLDSQMENSVQTVRPGESQQFNTLHRNVRGVVSVSSVVEKVSLEAGR